MNDKLDTYLSALDSSLTNNKLNETLFTPSQQSLFQKAIKEACQHFKSVSKSPVKKEKLLQDYKFSEFGSKLSSTLQTLARQIFPGMFTIKAQDITDFQELTSVEEIAVLKSNPDSKTPTSADERKLTASSSEMSHQRADELSAVSESQLRRLQVCLASLDRTRRNSVGEEKPGNLGQSRGCSSFSNAGLESLANCKGSVKVNECSVQLKRININEDFHFTQPTTQSKHRGSSSSDNQQNIESITAPSPREIAKHIGSTILSSGRKRKAKKSKAKAQKADQINKENLSASDQEFENESVPSSDLDESNAEDDDMPCTRKRQKKMHQVLIPDLQQFIRCEERLDETTPCSVSLERLIL
ncbi:hypothetical protein ElyMa_006405300 [Elysia marginata]|uniref:Uncharacterized protein n=1 Tax=Elysia marginata TaxID=1093978 RepID=A0AAV4HTI5_9GAST|nr:hypothetical protein ElyMa_006405300 [Elysia marginata]